MHARHRPAVEQQKRVRHRAEESDAYAFFNNINQNREIPRLCRGTENGMVRPAPPNGPMGAQSTR